MVEIDIENKNKYSKMVYIILSKEYKRIKELFKDNCKNFINIISYNDNSIIRILDKYPEYLQGEYFEDLRNSFTECLDKNNNNAYPVILMIPDKNFILSLEIDKCIFEGKL